jgi:hypothetical protein
LPSAVNKNVELMLRPLEQQEIGQEIPTKKTAQPAKKDKSSLDEFLSSNVSIDIDDADSSSDKSYNEMPKVATKKKMPPRAQQKKKASGKKQPPKKKAAKTTKGKKDAPRTFTATNATTAMNATSVDNNSPSADTVPRTHVNALKMLEAGVFDEGYDSDGYIGPERGTDAEELQALQEEALPLGTPPNKQDVDTTTAGTMSQEEATHVPITEAVLKTLTVVQLKEELKLRKVQFKSTLKKGELFDKLKDALAQRAPKYSQQQLDAQNNQSKKQEDDMTAFAVGAWWRELQPMEEQVHEPANEQFPGARASTIPEEHKDVPLKPKYNYADKWDRPPFQGSAHGQERLKGRANDAFLKAPTTWTNTPLQLSMQRPLFPCSRLPKHQNQTQRRIQLLKSRTSMADTSAWRKLPESLTSEQRDPLWERPHTKTNGKAHLVLKR